MYEFTHSKYYYHQTSHYSKCVHNLHFHQNVTYGRAWTLFSFLTRRRKCWMWYDLLQLYFIIYVCVYISKYTINIVLMMLSWNKSKMVWPPYFFLLFCFKMDISSQVVGRKDATKSAFDIWKEVSCHCFQLHANLLAHYSVFCFSYIHIIYLCMYKDLPKAKAEIWQKI